MKKLKLILKISMLRVLKLAVSLIMLCLAPVIIVVILIICMFNKSYLKKLTNYLETKAVKQKMENKYLEGKLHAYEEVIELNKKDKQNENN